MKKTKSEPNIEIVENKNNKENNEGNNIIIKEKDKEYYILGGFPDFVEALKKRGWKE